MGLRLLIAKKKLRKNEEKNMSLLYEERMKIFNIIVIVSLRIEMI